VSAQKSLEFPDDPKQLTLRQAEDLLFNGAEDFSQQFSSNPPYKFSVRWRHSDGVTNLLDDVNAVMAVLFARKRLRDSEVVADLRSKDMERQKTGMQPQDAPHDVLVKIWNKLLPSIELNFAEDRVLASRSSQYPATDMSDGERVIFYLLAQVLVAKSGMILLIDEPEIHIHKSIVNSLWDELEQARPDCQFVYMTQDLSFASSRIGGTVIWVKSYDGAQWDWEVVSRSTEIPESLLLQILGTKRTVIFIEGEAGSDDVLIYQTLMPDLSFIPRGDCQTVILTVKAARNNPLLREFDVKGLIDRDYRNEPQIESMRTEGIGTLEVAEVEHFYCVPEAIMAIGNHLGLEASQISKATSVLTSSFSKDIKLQVFRSAVSKLREELGIFSAKGDDVAALEGAFVNFTSHINASKRYAEEEERYEKVLASADGAEILKIFNRKGLYREVAAALGLQPNIYKTTLLYLLRKDSTLQSQMLKYVKF
jgi:hypothetical protein